MCGITCHGLEFLKYTPCYFSEDDLVTLVLISLCEFSVKEICQIAFQRTFQSYSFPIISKVISSWSIQVETVRVLEARWWNLASFHQWESRPGGELGFPWAHAPRWDLLNLGFLSCRLVFLLLYCTAFLILWFFWLEFSGHCLQFMSEEICPFWLLSSPGEAVLYLLHW